LPYLDERVVSAAVAGPHGGGLQEDYTSLASIRGTSRKAVTAPRGRVRIGRCRAS
jgi:hypothetical protein